MTIGAAMFSPSSPDRDGDVCFVSPPSAAGKGKAKGNAFARSSPEGFVSPPPAAAKGKGKGRTDEEAEAEAEGEFSGRSNDTLLRDIADMSDEELLLQIACVPAFGGLIGQEKRDRRKRLLPLLEEEARRRGIDANSAKDGGASYREPPSNAKCTFLFDFDASEEERAHRYHPKSSPIRSTKKNYGEDAIVVRRGTRTSFKEPGQMRPIPEDKMYSSKTSPTTLSGHKQRVRAVDPKEHDSEKRQQIQSNFSSNYTNRRNVQHGDSSVLHSRKVNDVVLLDDEDVQPDEPLDCGVPEKRNESKIYYPSRDDPEVVELTSSDIRCLDPGVYLSSPVINYYIQYIKRDKFHREAVRNNFYMFNTYFYSKLQEALFGKGEFVKLRRWWKGVNIFQRGYIILPIHGTAHWSLVIICIPAKESNSGPIVLHLDSLGMHPTDEIYGTVRRFLEEEWKHLRKNPPSDISISDTIWEDLPRNIHKENVEVPGQNNAYDCGIFMLYYIERFITEAPGYFTRDRLDMFSRSWFRSDDASDLRNEIRKLLLKEFGSARVYDVMSEAATADGSDEDCIMKEGESEAATADGSDAVDGTGIIAELHGRNTRRSSPQHDSSEKASHVLDEGSARIEPVEKDSCHNERNLRTAGAVPSVSCNGAVQGDKSRTNLPQENATGPSKLFKEKNDKALLEVSCADKANPAVHDDGDILENNTSYGRKTALDSPCCNAVETSNVHRSNDSPSDFAAACLVSLMGIMPSSSQDKDPNGSTKGFTEQDLCIKCGKDGQLLKCSSCSLAAHDSCFGSSVTFHVSGQFYCPVCFCTKATEAYQKAKKRHLEATKNLSAFLGTKQFPKEHHEQSTGKQQTATNSKDHLNEHNTSKRQGNHQSEADNIPHKDGEPGEHRKKQRTNDTSVACPEDQSNGCDTSKRQGNHQSEADDLSHKDEEPGEQRKKQRTNDTSYVRPEEGQPSGCDTSKRQGNHQADAYNLSHKDLEPGQQRKKQKTNATSDACPEDVITEKASFGLNSDIAPNKDCVLQNKGKQVEQSVESAEAHEDGNGNSFYDAQHSSQNRCSPVANQSVEADKHDGLTNSHDPGSSDEIEATSSNNSGKRSLPPWRNMRHHKARFQEKDQHMSSPSSKRNYAYPLNCYPIFGRRSKLYWTEEEEQALRDAVLKFTPKDDIPISWIQILEYGRDTFHKTRFPCDLRVKWRNMKKSRS